ncbi:hypothetical protein CLIB1423_17S01068 [[Candida] railenensis]|uniref:Uncharacterized protein n=1 Tax=[Candida] railenensis TaxID=45579 RepID=A0A9P0QS51_9ASCO|nr:hypothetical protein CLIB1423_17S01068 [[Candida] railenensis]
MLSRIRILNPRLGFYVPIRSLGQGKPRSGRTKRALPLSTELSQKPNEFVPLYTKCGWFVVAKDYNIVDWTLPQLEPIFTEKLKEIKKSGIITISPEVRKSIQSGIDAWVATTKLPSKSKPKKLARADSEDMKDYLATLHENIATELTGMISETNLEKKAAKLLFEPPKDNEKLYPDVGSVKAWNYYLSKYSKTIEVVPEGSSRRVILAESWKKFSPIEKEKYRLEYGKLLESGFDISAGKVVDKNLKRKPRKKTSA